MKMAPRFPLAGETSGPPLFPFYPEGRPGGGMGSRWGGAAWAKPLLCRGSGEIWFVWFFLLSAGKSAGEPMSDMGAGTIDAGAVDGAWAELAQLAASRSGKTGFGKLGI